MKRIHYLAVLFIALVMAGCSGKTEKPSQEVESTDCPNMTAKEYVDNNTYIDIDAKALASIITNPDLDSSVDSADMAKMKAAIYRFYKNVKEVDGFFVCEIGDGASINISESLFTALKDNLQQINDGIKESREKGYEVVMSKPDSAYLNSLLN